jgi:predicted RNA-binding protein with RPS1 domain
MQDKVGYEFEGQISGLTDWGMYVEIEPTKIEGMVALRDIRGDFFEFDQDRYLIVGRRTGATYGLGDKVRISVKKANLAQKLLDYELVELGDEKRDPSRRLGYESNSSFVRGTDGFWDNVGSKGSKGAKNAKGGKNTKGAKRPKSNTYARGKAAKKTKTK